MTDRGDPDSIERLREALVGARAEAAEAVADAARAKAVASDLEGRNALLELQNAQMRRALYGQRAERGRLIVDQLELGYEELEASAGEDEALGALAAADTTVAAFTWARPSRKPLPVHLPRERVVISAPASCPCCGSARLCKLNRHSQAQRHRPAGLARRRPRAHRRHTPAPAQRTAAVEPATAHRPAQGCVGTALTGGLPCKGPGILLEVMPDAPVLIGGCGYDADWLHQALRARDIAISDNATLAEPAPPIAIRHGKKIYRYSHRVEIMFGTLKDRRNIRTATIASPTPHVRHQSRRHRIIRKRCLDPTLRG